MKKHNGRFLWQKYSITFPGISCKMGNSLRDSICAMLTDALIEVVFSQQFELN